MTTQATNVPAGLKLLRRWANGFFQSNRWVKVVAGLIILVVWQVGVGAFAPRFVAKPLGIGDEGCVLAGHQMFLISSGIT